jgi:hypothetical protein
MIFLLICFCSLAEHHSKAYVILLKLCTIALTMCQIELQEGYLMPRIYIVSNTVHHGRYALKALPTFKIYNNGKAPKAKGFPKIKRLRMPGVDVSSPAYCATQSPKVGAFPK